MRKVHQQFETYLVFAIAFLGGISLMVPLAIAGGSGNHSHGHSHGHGKSYKFGQPGRAAEVQRVVKVEMHDNFYAPKSINVKAGETVKFVVVNKGEFVHEFNIGMAPMHAAHQDEMMKMMEAGVLEADKIHHHKMDHGTMKHDDPNSVLLEPGQKAELVWKFDNADDVEFACNVPGHYAAGMRGAMSIN